MEPFRLKRCLRLSPTVYLALLQCSNASANPKALAVWVMGIDQCVTCGGGKHPKQFVGRFALGSLPHGLAVKARSTLWFASAGINLPALAVSLWQ